MTFFLTAVELTVQPVGRFVIFYTLSDKKN